MNLVSRALFGASLALFLGAQSARAQVATPPSFMAPHVHDTGNVSAPAAGTSSDLEVVDSFVVTQTGAPWLRLHFAEVTLAGDPLAGNGAELRVYSLLDGALQIMNRIEVERWQSSSAYFNGDTVIVEIWARPGTGDSRVLMSEVEAGIQPGQGDSICGVDDRLPSTDPRSGRLLPVGCTAWLIQDCSGCFLTAGHCVGNINVVQFNVPPSTSGGSLQHPGPEDQYPVDSSSVQTNGGQGVGDDFAYFGTFPNGTTNLTVTAAQGLGFELTSPPAPGSADIRITGYGADSSPPQRNQTQQTHVGPLVTSGGDRVQYRTDTRGGNSGSPVIWEQTGQAVGIHTHGGCDATGGQNSGTSFDNSGLQAFLANPLGVCASGIQLITRPDIVARGTLVPIVVEEIGDVIPGSVNLHVRDSASAMFQSIPMAASAGGVFLASLPGFECTDAPAYFVSAQTTSCGQIFIPEGGPNDPIEVEVGDEVLLFDDDFETSNSWQTAILGATSGQWQRGIPVNDPNWAHDPPTDGDGSGRAYLTQNQNGNTDVDNGAVQLTSPQIAITGPDARLRYLYYLKLTRENAEDALVVEVSTNGGGSWTQVRRHDTSTGDDWATAEIGSAELAAAGVTQGGELQVRFTANDANQQSIVEAGVDGVRAFWVTCDPLAVGTNFCGPAVNNSSGGPGRVRGMGSASLFANDLTLIAEGLPANVSGFFLLSRTDAFLPFAGGAAGNLCLGGSIGRDLGSLANSGGAGEIQTQVDWNALPQPGGAVQAIAGEQWYFQLWHRDTLIGPASNYTDGLRVTVEL